MKLNKISIFAASLACMTLASCSEGQYWTEPSDPGTVYAFAKPAETISIPEAGEFPSSYEVTVRRNTNGGAASVPVEFKSNSELVTGPATVEFADGSLEAKYTISFASGMLVGVNYSASLALAQPEDAMLHVNKNNLTFAFNMSKALRWESRGVAQTYSTGWVGNESPIEIPIEEAVNWPIEGQRLLRLVSPYWYMEPAYASKGYDIRFYVNDSYDVTGMYSTWQYIGEKANGEFYYFAVMRGGLYNEGNVFTMDGYIGYADSDTASAADVSAGWYETLIFNWPSRSEYVK